MDNVLTFPNLPDALKAINTSPLSEKIENVWIIGGASVYRVCNHFLFINNLQRIYHFKNLVD
jgi:dihydrofolate reductase